MAAQLGAALGMAALGGPGAAPAAGVEAVRRAAITHAASYAAALAAAGFMIHALRGAAEGLVIRARAIPMGLLAFALAYPIIHTVTGVSVLVATRIRGEPLSPVAHESLRQIIDHRDSVWAWGMAAGAVVGAPIIEEIMYRVFLQTALLGLWRRAWPAVITTAVLFAAVHIGVAETHALPVLLVLGLAIGVAYERTRSPVVPIVMHAAFNLLNVALALLLR
ncbi:MAG: CPBP family intramembrane metalloprotease [Phycisphaerales bacterium]|nr:CPBP family intramembrane metalloprotease [Phycisphaerales bacterium]